MLSAPDRVSVTATLTQSRTGAGAVHLINPFKIGQDGDRAGVIAKHETWLRDQHNLLRSIGELRGKDLVCFCAPAPCHGDLLLRLANGSRDDMIAWWRAGRARPDQPNPERPDPRRSRLGPSSTP
jgi:hypothetical protein